MTHLLRVAAVQLNAGLDKAANLAKAESYVAEAAASGAEFVVLPELFNLYGDLATAAASAEPLTGPTVSQMSAWAKSHKIWLTGSLAVQHRPGVAATNTAVVIDPQGQLIGSYDKIHRFDIELKGRVSSLESAHFAAGSEVAAFDLPWGKLGLAICYDLRFPELFRALSATGVQLLATPSAFTRATGQDHWRMLVCVRAVENQSFVVAANQVGEHVAGAASFGHSLIVDPWGRILAEASGGEEQVIGATLDRSVLDEIREQLPALRHRRM